MHTQAAHWQLMDGNKTALLLRGHIPGLPLMRFVASLGRRVSSERRARLHMQELVSINRRKDEVLATVCHELRSPLASIGHAMRLLGSSAQAPVKDEMQALIMRQVQRMSSLVDDLLDVTRIANGQLQLQRERIDLRVVVNNAIQTVAPDIQARHHQLTVTSGDAPVWLMADPLRLEQVFVNLLANATKYTQPGGQLALSVDVSGSQAVVRVRDSGIGIAPQLLPHVFDLFRQADEADTQSTSGLGIGLAIVRSLVQLHGGKVAAASRGSGRGSEFTVHLPRQD